MATIAQCKFCSKPFHSMGGKICPNCLDSIDADFIVIRDYIYDNPGVIDIDSICEATNVQKKVVLHLIDEKRLILSSPAVGGPTCSVCHKPIHSGTMCDDCKISLSSKLSSAVTPPPPKKAPSAPGPGRSSAKMHLRRDDEN